MTISRTPRIAVVGSNIVDLVTYVNRMPVRGETVEAPSFEMGHGGKGANQAVAAARLGASVVMVTKVGDDMFAENTIRNLASFGVDTTHVQRVAAFAMPATCEPEGYLAEKRKGNVRALPGGARATFRTQIDYFDKSKAGAAAAAIEGDPS